MINYRKNTIKRGGVEEPIKQWAVWFLTPFGMAETTEEAVAALKEAGLDAHQMIVAKPVAISETMIEAVT